MLVPLAADQVDVRVVGVRPLELAALDGEVRFVRCGQARWFERSEGESESVPSVWSRMTGYSSIQPSGLTKPLPEQITSTLARHLLSMSHRSRWSAHGESRHDGLPGPLPLFYERATSLK